ncbi:hypothetical protein ACIQ57_01960 [Lysinibacillus xylanilyticus]
MTTFVDSMQHSMIEIQKAIENVSSVAVESSDQSSGIAKVFQKHYKQYSM